MPATRVVYLWQWVLICLVAWYSPLATGQETAEDTTGTIIPGQTYFRGVDIREWPVIFITDLQLTGSGVNPVGIRNGVLWGTHKVLLDGMSITSVENNTTGLFSISPSMIEHMTLQTTSHTPEFIGGSSGVTIIETPEGGDRVQGRVNYRFRSRRLDGTNALRPYYLDWRVDGPLGKKIRWFTAGRRNSFITNAILKATYTPSPDTKLAISGMIEGQNSQSIFSPLVSGNQVELTIFPSYALTGNRNFVNMRFTHRIRPSVSYNLRFSHMRGDARWSNTEMHGVIRKQFHPNVRVKAGYLGTWSNTQETGVLIRRIENSDIVEIDPGYQSLFMESNISSGRFDIDVGGRFTRRTFDRVEIPRPELFIDPAELLHTFTSHSFSPSVRITAGVTSRIKLFGSSGLYHQHDAFRPVLEGYFKTEIGARVEVLPGYFVQVTGYDRDLRGRENTSLTREPFGLLYQIERDEDYRTLEFMLHKPAGRYLTFRTQYGLAFWRHLRLSRTLTNRRHRFMAHMALRISSNTTASVIFHLSSGRVTTGLFRNRTTLFRDERTDLQIQHAFPIKNAVRLGVFMQIRNAFQGDSDQNGTPISEWRIRRGDAVGYSGVSTPLFYDYFTAPRDMFLGVSARW